MPTATTNMALQKAVDADNAENYLTSSLAGSLDTLDGHDHSVNSKGLAVARITTTAIPVGANINGAIIAGTGVADAQLGYISHILQVGDGVGAARLFGVYRLGQIVGDGIITSFDFTGISAFYETLELVLMGRSGAALSIDGLALQFNGAGGTAYDSLLNRTDGTGANSVVLALATSSIQPGYFAGANATAGLVGSARITIPSYARTVFHKTISGTAQVAWDGTTNVNRYTMASMGRWASTAAINRVTVTLGSGGAIPTGCVASLYGIP